MCTCGAETLARRIQTTLESEERWYAYYAGEIYGEWGRFTLSVIHGVRNSVCVSCGRVRFVETTGGGTVVTWQISSGGLYVLMTDVVSPSCMEARFLDEERHAYIGEIQVLDATIPFPGTPPYSESFRPPGVIAADTMYRVYPPEGTDTGEFRLFLIDRCLGIRQLVGVVHLEDLGESES